MTMGIDKEYCFSCFLCRCVYTIFPDIAGVFCLQRKFNNMIWIISPWHLGQISCHAQITNSSTSFSHPKGASHSKIKDLKSTSILQFYPPYSQTHTFEIYFQDNFKDMYKMKHLHSFWYTWQFCGCKYMGKNCLQKTLNLKGNWNILMIDAFKLKVKIIWLDILGIIWSNC